MRARSPRTPLLVTLAALALAACSPSGAPSEGATPPPPAPSASASAQPSERDGVATVAVDFGTATDHGFTVPKRGFVVAPTEASTPSPVVALSHLRAPNCSDQSFHVPCPKGTTELRYDEGMRYLGERLADEGYVAVIPDLGPVFVGEDTDDGYSQERLFEAVLADFLQGLEHDAAAGGDTFGLDLKGKVDVQRVGFLAHSRSATLVDAARATVGADRLKAVLTYGGAYDTYEAASMSPAPADVPYLGVGGLADADVGLAPQQWLGHSVVRSRTTPASVVGLPGLGHMLVNRTAAKAGDDRVGCDVVECLDAAEHERVLTEVAMSWFGAWLRGAETDLPTAATDPLPEQVAGLRARWVAATPSAAQRFSPKDLAVEGRGAVQECVFPDPMDPSFEGTACPEPEDGVVLVPSPVAFATRATASVEAGPAQMIALHLAPAGTGTDEGTPVTVGLTFPAGSTTALHVPATDEAVRNQATDVDNGTYVLGTVRLSVPEEARGKRIIRVAVSSDSGTPVVLRGLDLVGE